MFTGFLFNLTMFYQLILSLLLLLGFSGLSFAKTTTVLIYWAVDNDLYKFSLPYLNQFKALPTGDKLNLFLEYDYPDKRPSERFINFKLIEKIGEKDSANPKTLSEFIKYGLTSFPADEYILIIASHGSNWSGLIEDRSSKNYMSLKNLRKALKVGSDLLPDKKFDLIIFDACRMSYLETIYVIGDQAKLFLGSPFDLNGFDHFTPLLEHVKSGQSVIQTAKTYVRVYPYFPGNREYTELGASLLRPEMNLVLLELSKFFNSLSHRSDTEIELLMRHLYYAGNSLQEDWGFDLLNLIKTTGVIFPETLGDSLFLHSYLSSLVLMSSVSPGTPAHGGLGLTCAADLLAYKRFSLSREIPDWVKLCKRFRKFPKSKIILKKKSQTSPTK
jgi:hypothetical protein